jgi:hypothetical protein
LGVELLASFPFSRVELAVAVAVMQWVGVRRWSRGRLLRYSRLAESVVKLPLLHPSHFCSVLDEPSEMLAGIQLVAGVEVTYNVRSLIGDCTVLCNQIICVGGLHDGRVCEFPW